MLTVLLIAAAIVITLIVRGNIAAEHEKKLRKINSENHKIYKKETDKLLNALDAETEKRKNAEANLKMAERAYGQAKDLILVLNLEIERLEGRGQKVEERKESDLRIIK